MKIKAATIDTPLIRKLQLRHFALANVMPFLVVLALPLYWDHLYKGYFEAALFAIFYLIASLGITVGFHRLFTHRSFKAARWLQIGLAMAGSVAAQGGVTSWVAIHRLHHERSDEEGDLHSPNLYGPGARNKLRGFLHAHFLWMKRPPYPSTLRYAPDMLRDPVMGRINRRYYVIVALGMLIPALAGFVFHGDLRGALSGLFWGGILRLFILSHFIWAINSVTHIMGTRPYETEDFSRNMLLLALPTMGESWHNNHHRFANSPNLGLVWYNVDPGYWFIKVMQLSGAAWDLRNPERSDVKARRQLS